VNGDEREPVSGIWAAIACGSPPTMVLGLGPMNKKSPLEKSHVISRKTRARKPTISFDRSVFLLVFIRMIIEKDPITGRLSRERMGAVSVYHGRRSIIHRLVNCRAIVASLTICRDPVILRT
jgi:hypothetical protein